MCRSPHQIDHLRADPAPAVAGDHRQAVNPASWRSHLHGDLDVVARPERVQLFVAEAQRDIAPEQLLAPDEFPQAVSEKSMDGNGRVVRAVLAGERDDLRVDEGRHGERVAVEPGVYLETRSPPRSTAPAPPRAPARAPPPPRP